MPSDSNLLKTISYTQIVDLSHIIDSNIPQWQGDPPVELESVAEWEKDGYYLRRFSMGEHSGTHLNAPKSFYPNGIGVDGYSGDWLVRSAVVIDICEKTRVNSDYALTIDDIINWERDRHQIPDDTIVIVYTGWQEKWEDPAAFFNRDERGNSHFPGVGSEAAKFLLEQRAIAGLGIDTHGIDPGIDTTFTTNKLVLEKPRIVLENLTNLDRLPPAGITLVIGVLRLRGGSGTPVSVLAFI